MHCQECNSFSYFRLPTGICGKCHAQTAKVDRIKTLYANRTDPNFVDNGIRVNALYARYGKGRKWNLNWFVIQCVFRHGLTFSETAEVLECEASEVRAEIAIAKLNVR